MHSISMEFNNNITILSNYHEDLIDLIYNSFILLLNFCFACCSSPGVLANLHTYTTCFSLPARRRGHGRRPAAVESRKLSGRVPSQPVHRVQQPRGVPLLLRQVQLLDRLRRRRRRPDGRGNVPSARRERDPQGRHTVGPSRTLRRLRLSAPISHLDRHLQRSSRVCRHHRRNPGERRHLGTARIFRNRFHNG